MSDKDHQFVVVGCGYCAGCFIVDLSTRWALLTQLIRTQPTTTDAAMGMPDLIAALALFSVVPDAGCDPDFEHLAGAVDDRAHRVVGHTDCQRCGVRQAFGHALQLRAASGQTDAVFDHLARGLQRQVADDFVNGFDDYFKRLLYGFDDVVAADAEAHRFACQEVGPLGQEQPFAFVVPRRADHPDDPFGFIREEQYAIAKGDHLRDAMAEVAAGGPDGGGGDQRARTDDGDVGHPVADVHEHL